MSNVLFKKSNCSISQDPRFYQELNSSNSEALKEVLWTLWHTQQPLHSLETFSSCQDPHTVFTSFHLSGCWELGERHGTCKSRLLQPERVHCSQPLAPDAENIAVLGQSKHFPIWEAHWVTSSFDVDITHPPRPRELFVWRQGWEREDVCLLRCPALLFLLPATRSSWVWGEAITLAL